MAYNTSSLGRIGARTLHFIEVQQKKANASPTKSTPVLDVKVKPAKTSKYKRKPKLRGTKV